MSEKVVEQAIEAAKEEKVEVIGKVEIFVLSDGNVQITGPLQNTPAIIQIFGKALVALANFTGKEMMNSPIVAPSPGLKV